MGLNSARILAQILKHHSEIVHLKMGDNHIGDEGSAMIIEAIRKSEHLVSLDISTNRIKSEGAKHIF